MNKEVRISPEGYQKLKEELEEAKAILEIKVRARTRELKELAESLEGRVKERTKELEESRAALMNILEDVDEVRALAEKERDKTKAIIANLVDGLIVLDGENKIVLINSAAEELLNVEAEEAGGKALEGFVGPSLKKLAELIGTKKGEKGLFREKLLLKEPVERVLEVTTVSVAVREETVIILHDVSREKLIERMKTEFVSLAAHQLRTPISAIKWTLRMLLDGDLGEITEEQREFIEKIYKSNERMITLIGDLLDVARIEEGRYLYRPIFVRFEDIVQSVISTFREEIKKRKIKFEFKKPEEKLPQVKVDVEKIRLVISNLLDNAIRYTLPGGEVTVSINHNEKEIEFSIKDTGVGIPADHQKRIFTKFFRGVNVIRMETEGTGLGLYITKNIIEAHGGRIWFESEENKGTTFYFTLPPRGGRMGLERF